LVFIADVLHRNTELVFGFIENYVMRVWFLLQVSQRASFGEFVKYYNLHCHGTEIAHLNSVFGT